ncbi:hypothetical protein C3Y87_07740 [Carbonactinospora thermoautotrophica]|uniref:hypothetical protein n=1 Tax=Carbonactinospora thermoautotrophica TaxID=1469144 RepID=UPI00226D6368|nr:hypothetical protein [Carbonactinospora thermoautotrophica]MCX9191305.1 hypothetical protein [Carbonactinospora thermoautotrophica]
MTALGLSREHRRAGTVVGAVAASPRPAGGLGLAVVMALWLARRGRGADLARWATVATGCALATAALLWIVTVGAASAGSALDAGSRVAVVAGSLLALLPVAVLLILLVRLAATSRARRLAGLRLAGATPGQVAQLVVIDTGAAGLVGALLGLSGFTASRFAAGAVFGVSDTLPLLFAPAVLVGVALASALLALAAMREVLATPYRVVRGDEERPPRPWGLPLVVLGLAVPVTSALRSRPAWLGDPEWLTAALLTGAGLAASASWVTARVGEAVAQRTRRATLLLAARRMQAAPRRLGYALGAVAVVTVVTVTVAVPGAVSRQALPLLALACGTALLCGLASLVLAEVESLLARRRLLAALVAGGVPRRALAGALVTQNLLAAAAVVVPAALLGLLVMAPTLGAAPAFVTLVALTRAGVIVGGVLTGVTATSLLEFVAVRRVTPATALRYE